MVVLLTTFFTKPAVVSANVSSSPYYTPAVNGYRYNFTSEVVGRNSGSNFTLEALIEIRSPVVPAGYMGGQARLFTSSGTLRASSSMTYTTSRGPGLIVYSPRTRTPGTYYSISRGTFYHGNGYNTYTGYRSPNMVRPPGGGGGGSDHMSINSYSEEIVELMLEDEYEENESGQTFGSALSEYTIGEEPDLISAIGTNGVEGFIKSSDLSPEYSTPEEAINEMNDNGGKSTIPLYDFDGSTIKGVFELVTELVSINGRLFAE